MKYAVINLAGKQYRVEEGQGVVVDKLEEEPGSKMTVEEVLMYRDGEKIEVGNPSVKQTVVLEVMEQGKGKKVRVAKFKAKSRYRKVRGHRQTETRVKVVSIGKKRVSAKKPAKKTKKS